jgi:hypothetical protein
MQSIKYFLYKSFYTTPFVKHAFFYRCILPSEALYAFMNPVSWIPLILSAMLNQNPRSALRHHGRIAAYKASY